MKQSRFVQSIFYRNRHILGFFALGFLLYYFICFGFANIPDGLSALEIDSAVLSGNFAFPASIVDLPYHVLQWLSIQFFGLSVFSIRVPSIILALLAGGLTIAAIRNLFRSNVAIITGLIAVSGVIFLDIARTGAPMIMSVFLLMLAIFAISQYLVRKKARVLWLIITVLALVVGTYSPLGVYFLFCSIVVALAHPRIRSAVLRFKIYQTILACLVGLVLLAPLAVAIFYQPGLTLTLLGIENLNISLESIGSNLATIILPWGSAAYGLVTPFVDFATLAIAIIGILVLLRDRHAARSYLVLGLLVATLIFTAVDAKWAYTLFVPMIFLVAIGISTLIDAWYKLFPINPVARIFGLLPLGFVIIGLVTTGHARYIDNNLYSESVVYAHDNVFEAAKTAVNERSAHKVNLVVAGEEIDFYRLLEREYSDLTVSDTIKKDVDTLILTPKTFAQKKETPTRAITGWTRWDNVLVKIYEK